MSSSPTRSPGDGAGGSPSGEPGGSASAGRESAGGARGEEDRLRIQITIGEQRFGATLAESAAARDLVAQLPVTVDMIDHGGVEKTGPLPSPLSLDGQPDGADPDVGDLGYYAPGSDLVLYYGDQSYFPGIVVLGRLDGDAAQRISELTGSVTARVEALDD
ncbi:hypothetical protein CLV56_0305 [Mumia flava]|uniref:Cyclophilin-like domain-containing protein n=1 Tax=Mumia flava TaxID=1348852 RepID=A0A2M9BDR6_9ACTN|nr:hypothetical protein CLV56_0305 [Mumia flava]